MVEIERGYDMNFRKELEHHRKDLSDEEEIGFLFALDEIEKLNPLQNLLKSVSDLTILNNRYKTVVADTSLIIKKQMLAQGSSEDEAQRGVDGYMKRVEFILKGGKVNV